METIFSKEIETRLKSQPKLLLKANAIFKKLGFTSVVKYIEVEPSLYYTDNITYIESPSNTYDRQSLSDEVKTDFMALDGFSDFRLDMLRNPIGDGIDFKYKDVVLGTYNKKKNYFLSYYPILSNSLIRSGEKNIIIPFFLDLLTKFVEENKLELADTSNIGRMLLAESFNNGWIERRDTLTSRIDSNLSELISYRKDMKTCCDNLKLHRAEKIAIESQLDKGMEKVEEVLQKIERFKVTKSIKIEGDKIVVEYGDISIKHRGKDIYIGDFIAKLGVGDIEIINRKPLKYYRNQEDLESGRTPKLIHHPHISGNSTKTICFGSARETEIGKYKSDLQYDVVVQLIFLFLNTYTEEDGGFEHIYPWIHAKDGVYVYNSSHNDKDVIGEDEE